MKKSWIEMVQDYVDARMAVGGCLLGVIITGVTVWAIWSLITTSWNYLWPLFILGGMLLWVLGLGVYVVEHSSSEKINRNMALILVLPTIVCGVGAVAAFAVDKELPGRWGYGIIMAVVAIAGVIGFVVSLYQHIMQE